MLVDDILSKLQAEGLVLNDKKRNGNETGFQLRFAKGEIVNVFDNGTIDVQGKNAARTREMLGNDAAQIQPAGQRKASRNVFVVYGHDM